MKDRFHELYAYDDGLLISKYTNNILCNMDRDGYIRVRVDGHEYRAHRVIWEMFNGAIPNGYLVDHIDGDVYNNRIENLRLATRQQNNVNSTGKKKRSSLPKGVTMNGNRYRAKITFSGKTYSLGTFATAEEASLAYNKAAEDFHKEFYRDAS